LKDKKGLFFREWFAVFSALCFMVVLFFMEVFPARPPNSLCESVSPLKVQVRVLGAVENPGIYEVEVGTSLKSILDQAGLKKAADRRGIYLKKKILCSCSLTILEKNEEKTRKKRRV